MHTNDPFLSLYQNSSLPGSSSAEGTRSFLQRSSFLKEGEADRNSVTRAIQFRNKILSKIAFGSYRIGLENPDHRKALQHSLKNGFNVIDTSSNYGNGESESLIGEVLGDSIRSSELLRENVFLITKAGYIQGKNLEIVSDLEKQGREFPEITYYSEGCYHCIHPDFLEDQLERSLRRLGLETVDVFLLHNPEYFLMDREKHNVPKEKATLQYYERIKHAFRFLESKRKEGKILHYGISSNTFPEDPEVYTATSLTRVLRIAGEVRNELGLEESGFAAVQFPGNLLERGFLDKKFEGKNLIEIARENGLLVLINRPLNAIAPSGNIRRLSYDPDADPDSVLDTLRLQLNGIYDWERGFLSILPAGSYKYSFRDVTEPYLDQFQNQDHLNQFLERTVIPIVQQLISQVETIAGIQKRNEYIESLNGALSVLERYVSFRTVRDRRELYEKLVKFVPQYSGNNLSSSALHWLCSVVEDGIVLLGMRREEYVDDAAASFLISFVAPEKLKSVEFP
ncbi:aldo/keto reductase [Leptospira gomenensis]|uniref:Aldo/keto reductase n=1 Tax=Leptospira gomenensis TaxID=2484974 RepID=A0A5F1YGF3_9LEPT|nr:aldo/keto reductase [Leptospira gomenensis]TGK37452.1 aldo/keto reductase [Leptospira gomenensis]TGK40811.1 aldo/keto reductase [Leptospira gomenensis]TGK43037.1 aldo/keto reductase [Leptospira gomenensis]TGK54301.1 aldo/keto reductase [Leptospira gomenensis]